MISPHFVGFVPISRYWGTFFWIGTEQLRGDSVWFSKSVTYVKFSCSPSSFSAFSEQPEWRMCIWLNHISSVPLTVGATPSWDIRSTSQTSWVVEKSTCIEGPPATAAYQQAWPCSLLPVQSSIFQKSCNLQLDKMLLPWRMKRSRNQGNSSYCCNVHQLLITRGRETFSWIQVDRLLGESLFNPLHFGSKTNVSTWTAPATKKQLESFYIFFHSRNSVTL